MKAKREADAAGTAALHIPSDGDDKEGSDHIEPDAREALKTPSTNGPISLLVVDRRREYGAPASPPAPISYQIFPSLPSYSKGIRGAAGTAALHIPSYGDDKEESDHIEPDGTRGAAGTAALHIRSYGDDKEENDHRWLMVRA